MDYQNCLFIFQSTNNAALFMFAEIDISFVQNRDSFGMLA